MTRRPWEPVLEQIRTLAAARPEARTCDAELLSRFVGRRDEAAFEALLRRHGPMVLRVARRVVGSEADAEDVFQATFLLLARRAASIRKRESVASWLHGVAHRLALSTRSKRIRRQDREIRAAAMRPAETPAASAWGELEDTLHEVLAQLPAKYRTPLVYCYLEGWTQEDVARNLDVPVGTLRSRVARGRELLRKRLLRRGIALSAEGASAALLASACASAETVPTPLLIATSKMVHLLASGGNAMTLIPHPVAALVRQVMTALFVAKIKTWAVCVLALALLVAGTGWAAHRTLGAKAPEQKEAAEHSAPKPAAVEERPRTDAHGDPLPPGAVARLGTMRFRHEGWIGGIALSPDDRTLAATAGKSAAFWDISTGRLTRRLTFIRDVHCLAFTPDGKSVAVGGEDCIVHLYDLASGKEARRFVGHQPAETPFRFSSAVWGVVFIGDGQKLITWGTDKTVRLWETATGKELRQWKGEDWEVRGTSPDGKLLAVTKKGSETLLHLLDAESGKEIRQLSHSATVGRVAFSPDGKRLAVAGGKIGQPKRIAVCDLGSGEEVGSLAGHTDAVFALTFSPDGKRLASGGYDKSIRIWDLASKKEVHPAHHLRTPVYLLTFSRDGKTLISRGAENHVRVWDVATWRERLLTDGPGWAIASVAYSPDGKLVATASSNTIWLWSTSTGKLSRTLQGHEGTVSAIRFLPDGKSLISGSYDGLIRTWDLGSGKEQRRMSIGKGWVEKVALSPDGRTQAAWSGETWQQVHLFHAGTGEKLRTVEVSSEQPGVIATLSSLCFSPDGKTLYAASGTHLSILRWETTTGKALPPLGKHDGGLNGLALAPDGRSVAAVTMDGTLYLWEIATGQTRLVGKDAGYATTVAFSPDGRLLAVANTGRHQLVRGNEVIPSGVENRETVRLVRVADGKVVRRFTGHLGGIGCLSFSPDGRTLASGGQDTTTLLWDVTNSDAAEAPVLKPEKLTALWERLRGKAAESYGCMNALIASPAQAVPFLGGKLKAVVAVDAERFAGLLKKLESDQFREREEATRELKKLGDSAEPALREALKRNFPLETRRRLQALLDGLDTGERLRTLRAIEVLERIGDKPARDLLRRLSKGAAGAWLTEEARTTLRRLK
ncbi:MAG TPA: sigma-70 family RNA polymerase sigma factor [Gemmataceae bacterium]|jgi:RNA polymerase sigma factor (sigma-70 family)